MARKIDWSKLLAAGMLVDRFHSFARQISPHYASSTDAAVEKVKRALKLKRTLLDDVIKFIGTDNLCWYWRSIKHSLQIDFLADTLEKELEIYKIAGIDRLIQDVDPNNIFTLLDKFDTLSLGSIKWENTDSIHRVESLPVINIPKEYALDKIKKHIILTSRLFFTKLKDIPLIFFVRQIAGISQICIIGNNEDKNSENVKDWIDGIVLLVNSFNPFRKTVLSLFPGLIETDLKIFPDEKLSIDLRYVKCPTNYDLFSDDVNKMICNDIPNFLLKQEYLCEKGFDGRRSYLLVGPPGSGKSHILRSIVSQLPDTHNVILVTPRSIDVMSRIENYGFLFPVLFLIEDIDMMVGTLRDRQNLQNFLDGVTSPSKMITIMTSNSPELLDDALVKRPGRIDRICYVLPGDIKQRSAQICVLTKNITLDISIEDMAKETDGLTFAQHREIIRRALIYSPQDGHIDRSSFEIATLECRKQFSDDLKSWKQILTKQEDPANHKKNKSRIKAQA